MPEERLPRLRREDLDEVGRELWDAVTAGRGARIVDAEGRMTGPFHLWLYTPRAGRHLLSVGGALRDQVALDRGLAELAICTTNAYWRTPFAWAAHVPMALEHGIDESVLEALAAGERPLFVDERQELVYEVASELVRTSGLGEALYTRAREQLSEQELVELVVTCGWYTLGAIAMNAFAVPMPAGSAPAWDDVGPRPPVAAPSIFKQPSRHRARGARPDSEENE